MQTFRGLHYPLKCVLLFILATIFNLKICGTDRCGLTIAGERPPAGERSVTARESQSQLKAVLTHFLLCRDSAGFFLRKELSIGKTKVSQPHLLAHLYVLLFFLIFDENISVAGKQTNLFISPHLCNELYTSCTGKRKWKLFSAVIFDGEVPVSCLAILVLLGPEAQDGTRCDAKLKGHQHRTRYLPVCIPEEKE